MAQTAQPFWDSTETVPKQVERTNRASDVIVKSRSDSEAEERLPVTFRIFAALLRRAAESVPKDE